jgi:hypothetical protein
VLGFRTFRFPVVIDHVADMSVCKVVLNVMFWGDFAVGQVTDCVNGCDRN